MRRRVLLLLKPFDVYPPRVRPTISSSPIPNFQRPTDPKILKYLDDRCRVHKETINLCQDVLKRKSVEWETISRNELSKPIKCTDLVISVGGDGTLLQASHFMDDRIPIVGVNSDPTRIDEVEEFSDQYDATRSMGYLCAATAENFEQVLDEILDGRRVPSDLSRISIKLNGSLLSTFALNDILIAHPCPASVSRFSFRIIGEDRIKLPLVNCRSSGLRVCTAAGSTAAMQSAGGFPMPIMCKDLQYMVREPILSRSTDSRLMHGLINSNQSMLATWYSQEGIIYVDGSHVFFLIQHGDTLEISPKALVLKVHLPQNLLA